MAITEALVIMARTIVSRYRFSTLSLLNLPQSETTTLVRGTSATTLTTMAATKPTAAATGLMQPIPKLLSVGIVLLVLN